jgi:hypothetical protein
MGWRALNLAAADLPKLQKSPDHRSEMSQQNRAAGLAYKCTIFVWVS